MKKLVAAILAFSLVLGVGGAVYPHDASAAGKKSYSSGTKSFQPSNNVQQDRNTNISKPDSNKSSSTVNNRTPAASTNKGGLMKGLLMGGLAGLLLGGLFGHLGAFGPILGLLLNVAVLVVIVMLARKLFQAFKKHRRPKDNPSWRS